MSKRYLTINADGGLSVLSLVEKPGRDIETRLTKNLFEMSRTTDRETHFDPAIHTREAIAAGISGHRALTLLAECEDTDLPTDRYFRNAWEWSD
jgi:hypothetical protein